MNRARKTVPSHHLDELAQALDAAAMHDADNVARIVSATHFSRSALHYPDLVFAIAPERQERRTAHGPRGGTRAHRRRCGGDAAT